MSRDSITWFAKPESTSVESGVACPAHGSERLRANVVGRARCLLLIDIDSVIGESIGNTTVSDLKFPACRDKVRRLKIGVNDAHIMDRRDNRSISNQ